MSIQIKDIVIFSHDGQKRELPLKVGATNIITGDSKTGKSALIDIIDYCFGSNECRVPEGPIRKSVSWFGLRLQVGDSQVFVARRVPPPGGLSSEEVMVRLARKVEIPDPATLTQTTNTTGLVQLLTTQCGIRDNVHNPPAGQTRKSLSATVRHAVGLCFQPQDEIIRRDQLFHGTSDNWVAQALKDTLPYFLGAVDDDFVRKTGELRLLKSELRSVERQLGEIAALQGEGATRSAMLLSEARDTGLTEVESSEWEQDVATLRQVASSPLVTVGSDSTQGLEYSRLTEERNRLLGEQRSLRDQIEAARSYNSDEQGYSREAEEQRGRLLSIGVFGDSASGSCCPLCLREIPEGDLPPTKAQIADELERVSSRLESVKESAPHIQKAIGQLEERLAVVHERLQRNRVQMEAVRSSEETLREIEDQAARQALVKGRIGLYLESLPEAVDIGPLEEQTANLRERISLLKNDLSDELIQSRLESIGSILGRWMTDWARILELEHSKYPLRLDMKKLTIVADTYDGPLPMERMGSGENWVGYHLIGHMAIHSWFTTKDRPTPRFLFLDQPSQVYFPPDQNGNGTSNGLESKDRQAVERMFEFVIERVQELDPGFQVIITEHADIKTSSFQEAVIERWRNGLKLVPDDWPSVGFGDDDT